MPEIVQHGVNGYVCDSIDEMTAAVAMLSRINRQTCRLTMEERFSDRVLVSSFEHLYREIMEPIGESPRIESPHNGRGPDFMHVASTDKGMRCVPRPYAAGTGIIPGVVVSTSAALSKPSGGIGMCAQEYLRSLEAAGFRLEIVTFDVDKRPLVRLRRKLLPRSYANMLPPFAATETAAVVRKTSANFVFLLMTDTAPLAESLRSQLGPGIRISLLSHGTESVDYLHKLRARAAITPIVKPQRLRERELSRQLCAEASQREFIDHVFCLSPFEAEVERWLGAKAVTWLPRTVSPRPLSWRPQPGRAGFVGSLEHEPNIEGLLKFACALEPLAPKEFCLRVVGAPETIGRRVAQRFRFIEYLGPLSDVDLEAEAGTWGWFVNPTFCYPRGCNTKLATALGWQIPVLTTPGGCRGYAWTAGQLPIADTPDALARLGIAMLDPAAATAARREVQRDRIDSVSGSSGQQNPPCPPGGHLRSQ